MFEDATFHSSGILPNKAPQWMLLTLAINLALVATLIILPLLYPQGLPSRMIAQALYAPPPPPAALPHPQLTQSAPLHAQPFTNPFAAPPTIPKFTRLDPDPGPPSQTQLDLSSGAGSSVGSTTPATTLFRPTPPPAVRPAPPQKTTISSGVAAGLRLTQTLPPYPAIAKAAGVSGTVVLAATISTSGSIENLRVLSGPPLLRQAAMNAVQTWRYRPYQLNNQPIEIDTTINVVFSMSGH